MLNISKVSAIIVVMTVTAANANSLNRFDAAVRAACPEIDGVSLGPPRVVFYRAGASCKAAGDAAAAAFDPNSVVEPFYITKADFLDRVKATGKLKEIVTASQTNADVSIWILTAQSRDRIDLNDPLTKQGLDELVKAGLISQSDEDAILSH